MGLFDFFSRRSKSVGPSSTTDRYYGRPLLILLENYVMSAIGTLAPDKEQLAASLTQRVFGGDGDWRSTLRSTLHLGDSLDESLRQMWATNQQLAQQAGVALTPEEFARMVADRNFAHLIDPIPK
ncbi:hypothetical protein [Verrucomicrobium sp. BvORR034]|uniref:hypothetical protein n=1 Tax=Verrucomicrobium sp. BvORR034 TaxID=1396418 RepID=UPI0006789E66|nr:hypothetical protein [Verrucomicrobium sp. BvORR034]